MENQDNLNFEGAEWVKDAYFVKTQQDIDFIVALDKEDYKKAEQLLKDGANINVCTKDGDTIDKVYSDLHRERRYYVNDKLEEKYWRQTKFLNAHGAEYITEESEQIGKNPPTIAKLREKLERDALVERPLTRELASNYSKLRLLRKKMARNIDFFDINLEDMRLPTFFKEHIEKPISDKFLGKIDTYLEEQKEMEEASLKERKKPISVTELINDKYVCKTQQDIDFIVALDKEDYKKAEQLLKDGANVNVCTKDGETLYKGISEWLFKIADAGPRDLFAEMHGTLYGDEMRRKSHFLKEHGAELETPESKQIASNYSKLGQLRKKIAKSVDNVLGTNLEDVKLPTSFKEHIEKPISDKVLGKLTEKDR